MLVLNETMDQLNIAVFVFDMCREEDGCVLRMAVEYVVEAQRKKRDFEKT